MRVILLKEVDNLGALGDIVDARDGYVRNYLIPYGLALFATPENEAEVEKRKIALQAEIDAERAVAMERKQKIDGLEMVVRVETKDGIEMFGSIGANEIIKHIKEICGEEVHKSEIILTDGAFRKVGEHKVGVKLYTDVVASVMLIISSSDTREDSVAEDEARGGDDQTGDVGDADGADASRTDGETDA